MRTPSPGWTRPIRNRVTPRHSRFAAPRPEPPAWVALPLAALALWVILAAWFVW